MDRTVATAPAPATGTPSPAAFPLRLARALRIVHPFPTLLNVAATAAIAFAAADGDPGRGVLIRMLLAMLLAQSAIGITNDLFDRDLDARTKPGKPLVSGAISARAASVAGLACVVVALVLAATLGAASLGLFALGTACGLAYDALFKRMVLSPLPFMLAVPTLPVWVYVASDAWDVVLWWLWPLGALLGLAIHLANTAPDIAADAAHGVRGLAHRLGLQPSLRLGWAAFAAALAIATCMMPLLDVGVRGYLAVLAAGAASLAAATAAVALRGERGLGLNFGATAIGAAITAGGWLAVVT